LKDLAELSAEDFKPFLEESFRLPIDEGQSLELRLIEVVGRRGDTVDGARRSPFSIVFRGPHEPALAQQICRLEHPRMGRLALFLVPVGPDEDGMRYEAVFS